MGGGGGGSLCLKRELLWWKHPRAQSFREEGNEGGEDGAFTQICLSSLSLFVFLSFNGFIFFRDVLVFFLGFRCSQRHKCMDFS